jgi:hypothetical protein
MIPSIWKLGSRENINKENIKEKPIEEFGNMEVKNMSHKLPEDVADQILKIRYSEELAISKWDVYPDEKNIVIKVYEKPSDKQILAVQNTQIDNWKIKIQYDEDFHDRMINARNELQAIKNDPAYRIAYYEIEESPFFESPRIWIVVFELSPENKKLNGTKIQGWEIVQVGEVVRPPSQS